MKIGRLPKSQRGQAMLETALVLLVLLVTLIGIFDLGQILFIHQTFVERVRNACRYGIIPPSDLTAIKNMVLYNQPTVPPGQTAGIFGLTDAMVSVSLNNPGTDDARIVVAISNYPYQFFSPLIAGAFTGRPIVASLPVETP